MNNPYGFDWHHQRVTRMAGHKGATIIRALNKVTGQYVDCQTSPAGRKNFVNCGQLNKEELKRELEQPE